MALTADQVFSLVAEAYVDESDPWGCGCSQEFEYECDGGEVADALQDKGWEAVLTDPQSHASAAGAEQYLLSALRSAAISEFIQPGRGLRDLLREGVTIRQTAAPAPATT